MGERLLRRLAGVGLTVTVTTAICAVFRPALLPWVLFGAAVAYAVGIPSSWLLGRSGPTATSATILLHALAGAGAGGAVGLALGAVSGEASWLPLWLLVSVPTGATVAGSAAASALALPHGLIRPVGLLCSLLAVVALPVLTWASQRPPAPYDFVELNATEEVIREFGDAEGLARAIAASFERRSAAGLPRTAHGTWVAVAAELSDAPLGDSELWIRFTADEGLPRSSSTDRPVRPVTVIVRGRAQACLLVTDEATQVYREPCRGVSLPD